MAMTQLENSHVDDSSGGSGAAGYSPAQAEVYAGMPGPSFHNDAGAQNDEVVRMGKVPSLTLALDVTDPMFDPTPPVSTDDTGGRMFAGGTIPDDPLEGHMYKGASVTTGIGQPDGSLLTVTTNPDGTLFRRLDNPGGDTTKFEAWTKEGFEELRFDGKSWNLIKDGQSIPVTLERTADGGYEYATADGKTVTQHPDGRREHGESADTQS